MDIDKLVGKIVVVEMFSKQRQFEIKGILKEVRGRYLVETNNCDVQFEHSAIKYIDSWNCIIGIE